MTLSSHPLCPGRAAVWHNLSYRAWDATVRAAYPAPEHEPEPEPEEETQPGEQAVSAN